MTSFTYGGFRRLMEAGTDWLTPLVTPAKGDNGPRLSDVETNIPIVHVEGSFETVPPAKPAKRKAATIIPSTTVPPSPPATPLPLAEARLDSDNPRDRAVAWAIERERIRQRKETGEPPPWTGDPILAAGRFCNVYREHDAVTRWVTANIVEPHRDDPDLWFALLAARCCSNEPDALAKLVPYLLPFDAAGFRAEAETLLAQGMKGYRTDAYKPIMPPRELKGIKQPEFHTEYVLMPAWRDRERYRSQSGETLASYSNRLQSVYRVGPFLAAQIVADLKHVAPLRSASDWWAFAAPGPGSERGLNRVCGRPIKTAWSEAQWHATLMQLAEQVRTPFADAGLAPLDAQNLQNVLCEFDKYDRARENGGKPSRKYQGAVAAAKPAATKKGTKKPKRQPVSGEIKPVSGEIEPVSAPTAATPGPELEQREPGPPEPEPSVADPRERPAEPTAAEATIDAAPTAAAEEIPAYILNNVREPPASNKTGAQQQAPNSGSPGSADPPVTNKTDVQPPGGGSKTATADHTEDQDGEPFNDARLLLRGYQFIRSFDYTLPDGTVLYQQRRYELKPGIPVIKGRPRKRFLIRRPVNGAWIFGAGPRRVLYHWSTIMRAGPGATVLVPEGEGKVDDLAAKGLLATTVVSHLWAPECVAALTGYHLIILADHDKDGETLAADARAKLQSVAASLRVVPYAHLWKHLPPDQRGEAPATHDDVSDWLKQGGDPSKLLDICRELPAEGEIWRAAPIGSWAGKSVPLPEYTVNDRIPSEQVFLLSGEGGGGKSSVAEHLCAAHVLGREWLGCGLRQGRAIYIECEDAERVLWWRLAAIANHYGVPIESFEAAGLQLFSLVEHDTILAFTNKRGIVEPTAAYHRLYEMAADLKPVQIAIASVANIFAGSEINRTEVQQFIKLLNRIPAVTKGSLTLVSQPSLTGIASTDISHRSLSGTTQWHNAVRGRAAMEIVKPKNGEGNGIDTGLRTLAFYKNQYGPPVAGMVLHWQNGLYLPVAGTVLNGSERAAFTEQLTIMLLQRFAAQNRTVSIKRNPNNYAPTLFAETQEAEAAGITAKEFKLALERLLGQGRVENAFTEGGHGKHRGVAHLQLKPQEEPA
jgi:RecA-family ATPase